MKQAYLLTGKPGTGKTSLIKQVIAEVGSQAGGFYTEEIRSGELFEDINRLTEKLYDAMAPEGPARDLVGIQRDFDLTERLLRGEVNRKDHARAIERADSVQPSILWKRLTGAAALGNLSAFYFYSYVAMQIPTGMMADRWGPRRLLTAGAGVAALGTALFAFAPTIFWASMGRLLIGASVAVAFVSMLKLASHWFPQRRDAMLTGLGLLVGNIGALVAQVPLRLLVDRFAWRPVTIGSAAAVLGVALLTWLVVRNDPDERGYRSYAPDVLQRTNHITLWQLLKGFGSVFGYRNTWLIFCAQGGFVGSMISFTGLWGPPFLRSRFDVSSTTAAAICSVMIVCWAVASPICGHLSDKIGRRKPIYVGGALVMTTGWSVSRR